MIKLKSNVVMAAITGLVLGVIAELFFAFGDSLPVLGCLLAPVALSAQVEDPNQTAANGTPAFYLDAMSFRSHDSTSPRIDVYLETPFEVLKFVTGDKGFVARYEITVDVLDGGGGELFEKSWNEEVRARSFEETQGRKQYCLTQRSISMAPGTYTLRVQLHELESGRHFIREKKIEIPDYARSPFSISDIMLVNRATNETGHMSISPNVSGNLYDLPHGFFVFFEAYNTSAADSIQITYSVLNRKAVCIYSQSERRRLEGATSQIVARIDSARFQLGAYDLNVDATTIPRRPDTSSYTAQKDRVFVMRWANVPLTLVDLDLAIRQAKYIATGQEYDAMIGANTLEEKQKLFVEFWQKRNAGKDVQHNEYMEQYYSRVQYANEHFGHSIEGWRSDMGMVFILLGPPNSVDRHPFDEDSKPYEVWSYYDYNARVVFIDNAGFGDYRLETPIWDLVRRIK